MRNRLLIFIATVTAGAIVVGCGGGGGGSSSTSSPNTSAATPAASTSQTYTASATAGEVLSFTMDVTKLTYSYVVTKSAYGCEVETSPCHSGSGTLTKNSSGTYTPSNSPNTRIYPAQNGLLVGAVVLRLNNVDRVVPILGVSNPSTTGDEIAGTYNFMDLQCNSKSYGVYSGCTTYKGTIKVISTGASSATYSTCTGGNLAQSSPVCSNTTSGNMTHLGGGTWSFKSGASTYSTNYLVAFTAPNGQKVGFIDFNDPTIYGFGMGTISTTTAMVPSDIAGNYFILNNYGQAGAVIVNADGTTSSGSVVSFNGLWDGIATVTSGGATGYGMMAGNGVYTYSNNAYPLRPAYFELGLRVQ